MTSENWSRKQQLFHEILELPPVARRTRFAEIAQGDPELAAQLQRLVDASESEHLDNDFEAAVETLLGGPSLEEGTRLGPYRLAGEIAAGGMSVVYRAFHEDSKREVAIKVLSYGWASPRDHERLVREYRLVASLDDEPRIARLYDVGAMEDGTPWFAMELVRGGLSITDYCERHALSVVKRLALFRDVCGAVRHAHSRAIIHRDLKPSNILVSEQGELKLLDFGIAGVVADLNQGDAQPWVCARSLTPGYAAPEQLTSQPVGAFTDLYVLGIVLYELLTGSRPFDLEGRSVSDVRDIIAGPPPQKPSAVRVRRGLGLERADWGDLDAICMKLLAVDPKRRYEGVDRLLDDVERYLAGRPVSAHVDSLGYRARKFTTRHRRGVFAAVAMLFAVTALTTAYAMRLAAEQRATLAQAARTERLQEFMLGLFSGAEPEAGPARELTVRRLLERGVLTAEMLTSDPDIRADLTHTLGSIYSQLGDFARAEELLTSSLNDKKQRLPDDDAGVLEGKISLALLRVEQMKLDEAERLARETLATLERSYAETHPLRLRVNLAIGKTLTARGEYTRAIAQLEPVVQRFDPNSAGSVEEATVLTELANAHQYAGHLDDAERLNRRALELDRRVHGSRHPAVADDLINLADAEMSRGRYREAEPALREAVAIYKGWYGSDHPETGSAIRILSRALAGQEKLDEAAVLLEEARDIFIRVYPGRHRRLGLVLNDLGVLATRRAERTLREAVALSREVLSENHTNTAIAEVKLGHVLTRQGRYADAIPLLEQGRTTMLKQRVDPSASWLKRSSEDLVIAFERTGRRGEADRLRAEAADPR
jgi:tetratricopeptide (TPR) repeat protein/tRNA A-37 threonylcarbamoyl transferase component Bud32